MAINTRKMVVGGLAAGVTLSVIDFVANGLVFAQQNEAAMNALNSEFMETIQRPGVTAAVVLIDFLFAFVVVWTYAAIRPRFGPGPKTAFLAGLQAWVLMGSVYLFMTVGGMFEWAYLALGAVVSFVMIQAAAQVGGMVYSEEHPAAGAST